MLKKMYKKTKGFTLIELLIVIAIIAIIAAVVFVALDPLTRFQDARDSSRWSDVSATLTAIKVDQVDNGGQYVASIAALTDDFVYMIGDGTKTTGCESADSFCDTNVTTTTNCVDLSGLVDEGYLGELPVSANGNGYWAASSTGYTITKYNNGSVRVRACESENSNEITATR